MASQYRTARKRICDAIAEKIQRIDGQAPFNSNIFKNAHSGMVFLDEIQEYPKVCVVAGDETREYQPNEFKWRFLSLDIRVYVEDQDDPQEVLASLMEDIERVIDNNDVLTYDDTVSPHLKTTSLTLQSMSTDEGTLTPLGIGELTLECRY
jgi:hypothetical protein|tara:strand:+ start:1564 stop:2016 length:453 start_codon:yes stop_codon:yes gene_type:complete